MTGQTGMMGLEEMDLDCGNFFDQMDDLLDFPNDDVEAGLPPIDRDSFPPIWSSQSESLPSSDSVFSADPASDLSAQLSVPYEDIVQLEWLSNFVDDSFASESLTVDKQNALQNPSPSRPQFQASSPISVLESSSSCSDEKTAPRSPESSTIAPARCGRARSKRRRPANFDPRPAMRLISPTSSATETPRPVNSDGHVESRPVIKIVKKINPEAKKKKISFTMPVAPVGDAKQQVGPAPTQAVRKCLHCEITKTPQWRAGPMGPKTLCNACGVRYKSGRLYPEYRPAASPTFVASLHSNSHKKVLEMRSKAGEIPAPTNSTESVSNTAAARTDYI